MSAWSPSPAWNGRALSSLLTGSHTHTHTLNSLPPFPPPHLPASSSSSSSFIWSHPLSLPSLCAPCSPSPPSLAESRMNAWGVQPFYRIGCDTERKPDSSQKMSKELLSPTHFPPIGQTNNTIWLHCMDAIWCTIWYKCSTLALCTQNLNDISNLIFSWGKACFGWTC